MRSKQLELRQVLRIDNADRGLAIVDHDEIIDAMALEEIQNFHGEFVLVNRYGVKCHEIAHEAVGDLMTLNPVTVHQDKLAVEVLNLLERHRIDDLVVVDDHQAPVGIVDSQDLTKLKLL